MHGQRDNRAPKPPREPPRRPDPLPSSRPYPSARRARTSRAPAVAQLGRGCGYRCFTTAPNPVASGHATPARGVRRPPLLSRGRRGGALGGAAVPAAQPRSRRHLPGRGRRRPCRGRGQGLGERHTVELLRVAPDRALVPDGGVPYGVSVDCPGVAAAASGAAVVAAQTFTDRGDTFGVAVRDAGGGSGRAGASPSRGGRSSPTSPRPSLPAAPPWWSGGSRVATPTGCGTSAVSQAARSGFRTRCAIASTRSPIPSSASTTPGGRRSLMRARSAAARCSRWRRRRVPRSVRRSGSRARDSSLGSRWRWPPTAGRCSATTT